MLKIFSSLDLTKYQKKSDPISALHASNPYFPKNVECPRAPGPPSPRPQGGIVTVFQNQVPDPLTRLL